MIERIHKTRLRELLDTFPVVALVGPRQVGKSTLVQQPEIGAARHYCSLDDFATLDLAQKDPLALIASDAPVTIDEVQRAPSLLMAIKREVDRERRPGRYLLTGSANLDFSADLSQILAGRVGVLHLPPISWREQEGRLTPPLLASWLSGGSVRAIEGQIAGANVKPFTPQRLFVGGFPLAITADTEAARRLWFESFRYTYLERDVRQVSAIGHLTDFARLLEVAASRTGQILNQSALARDVGLTPATAGRYFSLLEATFQIMRLPPYFSNIGKRLVKAPKLYWRDTGLAGYLMGVRNWDDAVAQNIAGALFETFVILETDTLLRAYVPEARLFYARTQSGIEVDGVIQRGQDLLPFEIKASRTVRTEDAAGLTKYMSLVKRAPVGVVVYMGREVVRLASNVIALPVATFLL